MSDKIKDEGIARVYQFLSDYNTGSKNWKEDADLNKDDVVVQSEFRTFMLKNFDWNGEENKKINDIITNFWNSINVNKSGSVNAKGVKNAVALDQKELENISRNIEITKAIEVLLSRVDGYKCPELLNDKQRWMTSMQASVAQIMASYTGSVESQEAIIKYMTEEKSGAIKQAITKTNADCIKDQLMETEFVQITSTYPDYKYMDDKTLKRIIDKYIGSLKGDETFQDIMDSIKCLMNDYFSESGVPEQNGGSVGSSTAFDIVEYDANGQPAKNDDGTPKVSKPGSQTTSADRLNKFGGADNNGKLNDLQKAVIKSIMQPAIENALSNDSKYKTDYTENPSEFKDIIDNYINQKVSNALVSEFESLKSFDGKTFITEKASELDTVKANISTLKENRGTLIGKVQSEFNKTDEYSSERRAAIVKVFGAGANSASGIATEINKLSQSELKAKEDEFDAEIEKINKKLPSTFLSKLPSTMTSVVGGSSTEIQLDNYYLPTYNTGDLVFKATGWGLSVSQDGKVTVSSNTKGAGTATVEVYDKQGNLLASKQVSVKVADKLNMAASSATFNGKKISELFSGAKDAVQLSGFKTWADAKRIAKNSVERYINTIASTVKGMPDVDSARVDLAATRTKLYYTALIDQIDDRISSSDTKDNESLTFTYLNEKGETQTETTTYSQKTRAAERYAGRTNEGALNMSMESSGIRMNESYNSTNTYEFYLNSAVLLKKFENFYNM